MSAAKYGRTSIVLPRGPKNVYLEWVSYQVLKAVRFCTFNSPVRRGKFRLSGWAMRLANLAPTDMIVPSVDGRRFCVDLTTGESESLFFIGEYERAVTRVFNLVVEPGYTCLDIGANFGWYTTLLSKLSGERGTVHAFEPVPKIFEGLKKNVALLDNASNVVVNNLALGDTPGIVTLHVFPGLPDGHSSLSTLERADYLKINAELVTLDSYIESQNLRDVDFAKVDIEGAELMLLKGGRKLFEQKVPPILMMEMALATCKGFGYIPNDLIVFLREHADYEFYAVDEVDMSLQRINGFASDHIGANVLCLPSSRYGEKFARLSKRVRDATAA